MYLFYLGDVLLPVAPSKLQTKISNKNKTMVLINEGEINLPKTPGLTDLSFECLLPATEYPFARYQSGFQKPSYYLSVLEQLKVQGKAFSFRVLRQLDNGQALDLPLSMMVTLEKYTTSDVNQKVYFTTSTGECGYDLKLEGTDDLGNAVEINMRSFLEGQGRMEVNTLDNGYIRKDAKKLTMTLYAVAFPEESGRMSNDYQQVGEPFTIALE